MIVHALQAIGDLIPAWFAGDSVLSALRRASRRAWTDSRGPARAGDGISVPPVSEQWLLEHHKAEGKFGHEP